MLYKNIAVLSGLIAGAWTAPRIQIPLSTESVWFAGAGIWILYITKNRLLVPIVIFSFLFGLLAVSVDIQAFQSVGWRAPGKIIVLNGEVTSFPEQMGSLQRFDLKIIKFRMEETDWQNSRGKVRVYLKSNDLPPLVGDRIFLKGKIRFPQDSISNDFGIPQYRLFVKGYVSQIYVRKPGDLVWNDWNPVTLPLRGLQLLREFASSRIDRYYSIRQAEILKSLLLGFSLKDDSLRQIFTKTGTSQVFAMPNRGILESSVASNFVINASS